MSELGSKAKYYLQHQFKASTVLGPVVHVRLHFLTAGRYGFKTQTPTDLRLQEDNVEDRLHNETPPTTSRGGVDVLANEVAKLRSTESQQRRQRRTSLSLQVQFCLYIIFTSACLIVVLLYLE